MTRLSRTYKTVSLANKTWFTVNKSTTKREKKVIFSRIGENEYIAHHNKNDYLQIKVTQVFHRHTISSTCHIDYYNKSLMHIHLFIFYFCILTIVKSSILARTRNRVYVLIYIFILSNMKLEKKKRFIKGYLSHKSYTLVKLTEYM